MKLKILLFCLILLCASLFRLFRLDSFPPALNWDEVSLGYNAYSILKTGQDEWGVTLPLSFRAFGDYKLPLYVYTDVPFIASFGLNSWGVRLPSALSGIGLVILTFLILKKLTGKISVSLVGMFLMAVCPWSIILSRIALEANLALFVFTCGFYLFLLGSSKKKYYLLAAICFGLSLFAYNSTRVIMLPFLIILALMFRKELSKHVKMLIPAVLVLLIFMVVAFQLAFKQDSSARYKWTTILDQGAINQINEARGASSLPPLISKLLYNKETYFTWHASENYLSHLNPNFLILNGGSNYQFSVPGSGLFSPISLIFFLIGVVAIWFKRTKEWLFIAAWFLIAPLPGAITRDAPHALHAIFMMVPFILICGLGYQYLEEKIPRREFSYSAVILLGLVGLSTVFFWQNYTTTYAMNYSESWQYGYKQAVEYVKDHYNDYPTIVMTKDYGEPHEFVLFYLKYDPKRYRDDPTLVRYFRTDWYWVDRFDKFVFLNDWEIKQKTKNMQNILLITSPDNYPSNAVRLERINFLDGKPAFDIVRL